MGQVTKLWLSCYLVLLNQVTRQPQFRDLIHIKIPSYQYRKFHCGDKTILWLSYLHNGIPILVRWHLYIELGTRDHSNRRCLAELPIIFWKCPSIYQQEHMSHMSLISGKERVFFPLSSHYLDGKEISAFSTRPMLNADKPSATLDP